MQKTIVLTMVLASCWATLAMSGPMAQIHTNMGVIVVELYKEKSPLSVANFIQYANDKFYNSTIFHRVIKDFMIQGGGFSSDRKQKKTAAPINNEAANGLKNARGTLAMARTNAPHSATSQFFINLKDNEFLNYKGPIGNGWGYTVFGKVIEGMDIVDKIAHLKTQSIGVFANLPTQEVRIEKVIVK